MNLKDIFIVSNDLCVKIYLVIFIFLVAIFYFLTKFIKRHNFIRKCLENFPEEPPVFFFGNALQFFQNDLLATLLFFKKKHGTLIKGQFGPLHHGLVVSDNEFIKHMLTQNKNLSKSKVYEFTSYWLGNGLLTSKENRWRTQRKILTPAFSNQILMNFFSIFNQHSNTLIEVLQNVCPTDSIDIHEFVSLCSLDIICDTVLGTSIDAQHNGELDYVRSVRQMCQIIANRSTCWWKHSPLFMLSADYQRQIKCLKVINKYTRHVINTRKKQVSNLKCNEADELVDEFGRKRKLVLLDKLLQFSEQSTMSEKEIEDEVHTFMFAGHDTVSATLGFLLFELSRNPEVQKQVVAEQRKIFDDNIRDVNFNDITEMRYLDMVIKETLRMYPSVPVIVRDITEQFIYKNNVIPEGLIVIFFLYGLHRDENLFPNPDIFDPTRFENPDVLAPFSFIPFSMGPRNCIGSKFAMFEMKVIISKLLRHFEILAAVPSHSLELRSDIVLSSKTGIKVKIIYRENK